MEATVGYWGRKVHSFQACSGICICKLLTLWGFLKKIGSWSISSV
jgi:hypothetical protein